MTRIPIVNYLDLSGRGPRLIVTRCCACQAGYLGERAVCARCEGRRFEQAGAPTTGAVRSFSIIHRAAPGIPAPFVSAIVSLDDGTAVRSNIINCLPSPESVRLGMRVELAVYPAGTDEAGVEAVAFGFAPAEAVA
jgi:uncharacterized protein